jgi:methyl-accepting chemotaxis protein
MLSNLRIGKRLALLSGLLAGLLLVLAIYGVVSARSNIALDHQTSIAKSISRTAQSLNATGIAVALSENSVAFDYNSAQPASGDLQSFHQAVAQFQATAAQLKKYPLTKEQQSQLAVAAKAFNTYLSLSNQINTAFRANNAKAIATANGIVGQLSFGSYSKPLTVIDTLATKDLSTAVASAKAQSSSNEVVFVVLGLIAIAVAAVFSQIVTRSITKPLAESIQSMERASEGDLTPREYTATNDEIGQMNAALAALIAKVGAAIAQMAEHAGSLASSSEELSATSTEQLARAEKNVQQSSGVASAADEVSSNVENVAAGAEQMRAAIDEIARGASEAAQVAATAVSAADSAVTSISKLGDSSAKVGEVVKVITSIAEQTNLLALNAAIEAARAGEAGKGFAVVASEVKDLAKETGDATESIATRIREMQTDTQLAIDAISEISTVINRINDLQASIATAVEEQSVTTQEIGRAVGEAAAGSSQIAGQIASVAEIADANTRGAADTKTAARELARLADELNRLVSKFKVDARSSSYERVHPTASAEERFGLQPEEYETSVHV